VVKPGLNDESGFSPISLLSLSLTVCGGQTAPHSTIKPLVIHTPKLNQTCSLLF
jgi:hypothetical protein